MKLALFLLALVSISTAAIAQISYRGGDGSTLEGAVIIGGAKGEMDGGAAEYQWLGTHFPDWHVQSQGVMTHRSRNYDLFVIVRGNETKKIYVDITSYFGKF